MEKAAFVVMGVLMVSLVVMFGISLLLHSTALIPAGTIIGIVLFIIWIIFMMGAAF